MVMKQVFQIPEYSGIYTIRKYFFFSLMNGYPKSLHSRVLFYPEAAFPLFNGSVILIRVNIFFK